jgi:hypothetical protein
MAEPSELCARAATAGDIAAIAAIYNQGIADRVATFETERRSPENIAKWFTGPMCCRNLMGAQGSQFYADNTAKLSCPHAYCLAKSDK